MGQNLSFIRILEMAETGRHLPIEAFSERVTEQVCRVIRPG